MSDEESENLITYVIREHITIKSEELVEDRFQQIYTEVKVEPTTEENQEEHIGITTNDLYIEGIKNEEEITIEPVRLQQRFTTSVVQEQKPIGKNVHNEGVRKSRHKLKKESFSCKQCSATFKNKGFLNRHQMKHTGTTPFSCKRCGLNFRDNNALRIHERIHTGETPYRCEQCSAVFTQKCNLKRHELHHMVVKPFRCDQCSATYLSKGRLKVHKKIHTGVKPFSCKECGAEFTRKRCLIIHKRNHYPMNTLKKEKKRRRKRSLKKHEIDDSNSDTTDDKMNNSLHNKMFTDNIKDNEVIQELDSDNKCLNVLQDQKPFSCDECKAVFTREIGLLRHKKIHLKETFDLKMYS